MTFESTLLQRDTIPSNVDSVEIKLPALPDLDRDVALHRLRDVEWNFVDEQTKYLTHGIHPYPAKFIPQIPSALVRELSSPGDTVADIFCGSGTTLLEALRLGRNAIGIDANPLAALISRAKVTPLSDTQLTQLEVHQSECQSMTEIVASTSRNLFGGGMSFASAGWRPDAAVCEFWFFSHVVEELAELKRLIDKISDDSVRIFCEVIFSSIIVTVSKQDSDTRYVRRDKSIMPGDTFRKYLGQLSTAKSLVQGLKGTIDSRLGCQIHCGDILSAPDIGPIDLVVTSPPYPNAYSYHLYHRTRLLWLGFDSNSFKRIEIGSHRKYSAKGVGRATEQTFRSEFERIFDWLRCRLRGGRYACFVIGDSTLEGRRIDNTSLVSAAGLTQGFREIARLDRTICATKKSFNPKIGKIKTENILILQKI